MAMAKAGDIEVDPYEPYAAAGARIVRVRARELFEHADGVLDTSDIERVHAMRVASRRLRAVLEVFSPCFAPEEFRPVLRDVKRIADALGERRDPDVHIEAMERFAAGVASTQRHGVTTLVARLRERQAAANATLAAALEEIEESRLAERLEALAATAEPVDPPEPVDPVEPAASEPEEAAA
jgi:CHAD domain-containing protein